MRSSKLALRNSIIQGTTAAYTTTALIIELRDYKNPNDAVKALFYLTEQQLIGLTLWNLIKTGRTVYIYFKNPTSSLQNNKIIEAETKNSTLNLIGGVTNARSWQVAIMWTALLRSNIPKTFLYHIIPSIISSLSICATDSSEGFILNRRNYLSKAAIMMLLNALDTGGSLIYTYAGIENPDFDNRKTLYGNFTDWVENPVTSIVCAVGVTIGGSLIFPAFSHGVNKLLKAVSRRCCGTTENTDMDIQDLESPNDYQKLAEPNPSFAGFISGCCSSLYNTICCKNSSETDRTSDKKFDM